MLGGLFLEEVSKNTGYTNTLMQKKGLLTDPYAKGRLYGRVLVDGCSKRRAGHRG